MRALTLFAFYVSQTQLIFQASMTRCFVCVCVSCFFFFFFPRFICIQSMAGCGLSEDTFLSSFFYNYGSSWETPSNQVRGVSVSGGVSPCPPLLAHLAPGG